MFIIQKITLICKYMNGEMYNNYLELIKKQNRILSPT
jgi:hypothetical protein